MRGPTKIALRDREGEEREVRKFLWFPRAYRGAEWRWLEWATILERIVRLDVGGSYEWGNYAWRWCEVGFADNPLSWYAKRV